MIFLVHFFCHKNGRREEESSSHWGDSSFVVLIVLDPDLYGSYHFFGEKNMIKIIAAMTHSRVIGNNGILPWTTKDIPGELKWFQEATAGHAVIMGRATWESLPLKFRPLAHRENIVVSKTISELDGLGVFVARDVMGAFNFVTEGKDAWVIGGAQIYEICLPLAEELYLTILDEEFEGDTYFPEFTNMFSFVEDVCRGDGWTVKKFTKIKKE